MKLNIIFGVILALAIAAVVFSERHAVKADISPAPILYFVADTERELTRIPVTLTRISDEDEVRVGDELAQGYLEGREKDEPLEEVVEQATQRTLRARHSSAHRSGR